MNSKSKKIETIDLESLEQMHTGSLMSRRKALLACEESIKLSDRDQGYVVENGYIEFKQTEEWKKAYSQLKSVLKNREHWIKGK